MQERLQKILSRAGVASRRKAEGLIVSGAVSVNGEIVSELGAKADITADKIRVSGQLIRAKPPEPIYIALNKPRGYISSTADPQGRRTVLDLVGRYRKQVYPVGRLDYHSEGLLLLTNDGEFANHVLSAKAAIPKTYQVKVNRSLNAEQLDRFRGGVSLDGRKTAPAQIRLLRAAANPWYEVTLAEGRNRQIRLMFQRLGVLVEKIKRVRVGPLALGRLGTGEFRLLAPKEVERFEKLWERPQKAARIRSLAKVKPA